MTLVSKKEVEKSRIELVVSVDEESFKKAVTDAFYKEAPKIQVKGFRKGKAPRHVIESLYGKNVFYEEAVNISYPEQYEAAVKEAGIEPVDRADVEITEISENGYTFKATVTVKPEVTLPEYKGIKAEKAVNPVTDDDITAEIEKLRDRNSRMVAVEGRAAAMGDTADIDFDGYVDGKPFEGGKGEKFPLTLGSGQFIPGFEEQVVGKNVGDEFDVVVTFPEDYQAEELKGKEATFKCKLNELKVREMPEVNDEFAKDVSEFDTIDELKKDMREKLEKKNELEADSKFETAVLDTVVNGLKVEVPDCMVEYRIDEMAEDFAYRLQSQGLKIDDYFKYTGTDAKAFRDGFREQALHHVKMRLALDKIAEVEGIVCTDEELDGKYKEMADQYKIDVEKVKLAVKPDDLKKDIMANKAVDLIRENAVVGKPAAKKTAAKKATAKKSEGTDEVEKKPAVKRTRKAPAKKADKDEEKA